MKVSPAQASQQLKKRQAKAKVIALVADGWAVNKAVAEVGRTKDTYIVWRQEDPEFARRVTALRLRNREPNLKGLDFVDFRQLYFGRDTAGHHYEMIEAVEKADPDSITMILAFPEAAKTSVMVDYVNYKLGPVDPNYRIVSITEGQDLARKIVSQVTTRMTDESQFGAYIERFGPFKAPDRSHAKPWNADYVCLLQSHRDEKEPNLEAKGWGSKIYGGRYDLVWTDDVQSSETLNQTPQLLRYLRQTVLTRPAKGIGRTVMTGSRVGSGDIYETMIDEGMIDNLVTIPALTRWVPRDEHFIKVGNKVSLHPDCPEVSSWPEYWSMLDLAKRRAKVGEDIWARTYMQKSVHEAAATFSPEMVEKAKDPTRGIGRGSVGTDVIISIDPALDTGVCAFLVCAYSSTNLWVLDAIERRDIYRGEDILVQLASLAATYRPSLVVIEENNFQKSLARDSRLEELATRFKFSVLGHKTYRNKTDPVMGVAMMASAFCDGEVSIPWAEEARDSMALLCDELRAWRPLKRGTQLKQDLVMCLWFIWIAWEERRGSMHAPVTQLWRPSWMRQAG